jgi:hypothetical protein
MNSNLDSRIETTNHGGYPQFLEKIQKQKPGRNRA